jgi:hypothetical protein
MKQGWKKRINGKLKEEDRKENVTNEIRQEDIMNFMELNPS